MSRPKDDRLTTNESARDAYTAALNGEHAKAAALYGDAAREAARCGEVFNEWAYATAEWWSASAAVDDLFTPPDDNETSVLAARRDGARQRARQLAENSAVRSWRQRAETRGAEALTHALEQTRAHARRRAHGGYGFSFSTRAEMAWRSFRDLEYICAPPMMQRHYAKPLLWGTEGGVAEAFRLRLLFDRSNTEEWASDLLDEPGASQAEIEQTASLLVSGFFENCTASLTHRTSCIDVVPGLEDAWQQENVPKLVQWFQETIRLVGSATTTATSRRILGRDYGRALRALGRLTGPADLRPIVETWLLSGSRIERDELADALYRMPWYRWAMTAPTGELAAWLDLIVPASFDVKSEANREDEMLGFTLLSLLGAIDDVDPTVVSSERRARILAWVDALAKRPIAHDHLLEANRAGFLLERQLRPSAAPLSLLAKWTDTSRIKATKQTASYAREMRWAILADIADDPKSPTAVARKALQEEWDTLAEPNDWKPIAARYGRNPHMAVHIVRFLVECLRGGAGDRSTVATRLISVIGGAPETLQFAASLVDPALWGTHWRAFERLVKEFAAGGGGTVQTNRDRRAAMSVERTVAAIDFWSEHLRRVRKRRSTSTSRTRGGDLLAVLTQTALFAISDERPLVSNHAAYAVISAAELVTDDDGAVAFADAIGRLGCDPRMGIRTAIAYGAVRLAELARHDAVKQVASGLVAEIESSKIAAIAVQAAFARGEVEQGLTGSRVPAPTKRRTRRRSLGPRRV